MTSEPQKLKLPSNADYLLRYDLTVLLKETETDYSESSAGGPRLLDQKDIAARFRKLRQAKKAPDG